MKALLIAAFAAVMLVFASPALAADGVTTEGGATVENGVAKLVADLSNTTMADDYSVVSFALPTGLTFNGISQLSAEFNVTNDDCGAGSPRFQIKVDDTNVFVALGPAGTLTGCAQDTWISTGNLTTAAASECRVDTSKFTGGKQCSSWAEAATLLSGKTVQSISLVVDSSWGTTSTNPAFADKEQTVLARNVVINNKTYLVPTAPKTPKAKVNPAKLCKAQMAAMGSRSAFNELWNTNASSNGFGKCVSAVAKARNAGATQDQILAAIEACKAKGLKNAALGACVAGRDGVAATRTEAQERKATAKAAARK